MLNPLTPNLAETTLARLYDEQTGPSLGFLVGLLAQPYCRAWSLSVRGDVVGAIWYQCVEHSAELLDLRVSREQRRSGHGALLLASTLRLIGDDGVRTVALEVRASNAPAVSLYRATGFKVTGSRPNYYPLPTGEREHAILMSMTLQEAEIPE